MTPREHGPFERLVAPGRAYPQLWRVLVGVLIVEAMFFVGGILVFVALAPSPALITAAPPATANPGAYGTTPRELMVVLASFAALIMGTALAAGALHQRTLASLIGPVDLRAMLPIAGLTVGVLLVAEVFLFGEDELTAQVPFGTFLAWMPLAIPLLALQTGAEEIYFRGYLQSQLAARYASPLIWMGVPSLFFASVHVDLAHLAMTGTWANNDGVWFLSIFLSGLMAADMTRVTGSLAAAWAWHFGNNFYAIYLVSMQGNMSGLALYLAPYSADSFDFTGLIVAQMLLLQVITWTLIRLHLARPTPRA